MLTCCCVLFACCMLLGVCCLVCCQSSMIRKASEEKFSYVILQKQLKHAPADERHAHAQLNDWTLDAEDVDPGNGTQRL